ncbi:MAG: hypothetical protein D084_Lepto4C00448G0003, partial [Leptospirillum sp. Group IV 'UBA BS']
GGSRGGRMVPDPPRCPGLRAGHGTGRVAPLLETSPREMGERLLTLKTSGCDLGWSLSFETTIEGLAVRLESLSPLYLAANGS